MVQLNAVRDTNASLVQQPLVAVFTGATSGIGDYVARALAKVHGKTGPGLRVYIVGRSLQKAEKSFAEYRRLCPAGDFRFVKADLSLIREVDDACADIVSQEAKEKDGRIDMLYMTQGEVRFGPRFDTDEGLDKSMALLYYSRMRFITQLLPLLRASKLPAHVVSVYAGGLEGRGKFFTDDLPLEKAGHYSFLNCGAHVGFMKTLFFEQLAKQNEGKIAFIHAYPFIVITPSYGNSSLPWWFRALWFAFGPLVTCFLAVSPEECGDRHLSLSGPRYPPRSVDGLDKYTTADLTMSTDGIPGGGAYAVDQNGEPSPNKEKRAKLYKDLPKDVTDRVWEHTMAVFETIEGRRRK